MSAPTARLARRRVRRLRGRPAALARAGRRGAPGRCSTSAPAPGRVALDLAAAGPRRHRAGPRRRAAGGAARARAGGLEVATVVRRRRAPSRWTARFAVDPRAHADDPAARRRARPRRASCAARAPHLAPGGAPRGRAGGRPRGVRPEDGRAPPFPTCARSTAGATSRQPVAVRAERRPVVIERLRERGRARRRGGPSAATRSASTASTPSSSPREAPPRGLELEEARARRRDRGARRLRGGGPACLTLRRRPARLRALPRPDEHLRRPRQPPAAPAALRVARHRLRAARRRASARRSTPTRTTSSTSAAARTATRRCARRTWSRPSATRSTPPPTAARWSSASAAATSCSAATTSSASERLPGRRASSTSGPCARTGPRLIGNVAIEVDLGARPRGCWRASRTTAGAPTSGRASSRWAGSCAATATTGESGVEGVRRAQRHRHLPARPAAAQERVVRRLADRHRAGPRSRGARAPRRHARGRAHAAARRAAGLAAA